MTLDEQQRLEYFLGDHVIGVNGSEITLNTYVMPDCSFVDDLFGRIEIVADVQYFNHFGMITPMQCLTRLTITAVALREEIRDHAVYLMMYYESIRNHKTHTHA